MPNQTEHGYIEFDAYESIDRFASYQCSDPNTRPEKIWDHFLYVRCLAGNTYAIPDPIPKCVSENFCPTPTIPLNGSEVITDFDSEYQYMTYANGTKDSVSMNCSKKEFQLFHGPENKGDVLENKCFWDLTYSFSDNFVQELYCKSKYS